MKRFNYLPWLIWGAVFIALYWVYIKLFTPYARATNQEDNALGQMSGKALTNGRSYLSVATEIFGSLYHILFGFIYTFSLKNTDETALGLLMQSIGRDEYKNLSDIYIWHKKNQGVDSDSLTSDLLRTFSKSEQKKYLGHLNIL